MALQARNKGKALVEDLDCLARIWRGLCFGAHLAGLVLWAWNRWVREAHTSVSARARPRHAMPLPACTPRGDNGPHGQRTPGGAGGSETGDGPTFQPLPRGGHTRSAAAAAGLKTGDILLSLDGLPIGGGDDLMRLLTHERIGQTLPVSALRNGEIVRSAIVPTDSDR